MTEFRQTTEQKDMPDPAEMSRNMDADRILGPLKESGNLRILPQMDHNGKDVDYGHGRMLNLSSNDYLGLSSDAGFYRGFAEELSARLTDCGDEIPEDCLFSSSSSRLLTGNFNIYREVESELASMYGTESALVFGSGYHMNSGILPAVAEEGDLILADKLVHASIIDGMRLCRCRSIRFRHQDLDQLESLVERHHGSFGTVFIVTESIFSMDGDVTDLRRLVSIRKRYPNVVLYVDEAHAAGLRGSKGLGVAEEQGCIGDIDFLCGTLGKALASVGGFTVCSEENRLLLVNRMRPFIFTTALPPVNMLWTLHVLRALPSMGERRKHLDRISSGLREALAGYGFTSDSGSQIIPVTVGDSFLAGKLAAEFRSKGFCLMPVRPPTVPEGTSRLRISLTAAMTDKDMDRFISAAAEILGHVRPGSTVK